MARKDTYRIDSLDDIGSHLTAVMVMHVNSRAFAVVRVGTRTDMVPMGVPLCSGCDDPVEDGPCSCERPA